MGVYYNLNNAASHRICRPIIGGVLSNAANRWPDTLGRIAYLRAHPYFIPCAVAGFLAFASFVIGWITLKEVSLFFSGESLT